ncbi:MAG: hypothetical protein O6834_07960 [Actinobacteria bacterium]|nr:hypothetical protein [Actinomycetota bacterium]MCZ6738276.1 hypothetical protein [Actinomycetota bacterium]
MFDDVWNHYRYNLEQRGLKPRTQIRKMLYDVLGVHDSDPDPLRDGKGRYEPDTDLEGQRKRSLPLPCRPVLRADAEHRRTARRRSTTSSHTCGSGRPCCRRAHPVAEVAADADAAARAAEEVSRLQTSLAADDDQHPGRAEWPIVSIDDLIGWAERVARYSFRVGNG